MEFSAPTGDRADWYVDDDDALAGVIGVAQDTGLHVQCWAYPHGGDLADPLREPGEGHRGDALGEPGVAVLLDAEEDAAAVDGHGRHILGSFLPALVGAEVHIALEVEVQALLDPPPGDIGARLLVPGRCPAGTASSHIG